MDWLNTTFGNNKLSYSALAAVVFIAVSLPVTYNLTDNLVNTVDFACPTAVGRLLHSAVFYAILYLLIKLLDRSGMSNSLVAKYAFYATLVYFLLSSQEVYAVTSQIPGLSGLTDYGGCPTTTGVIVHGIVFLVVLVLIMNFPKDQ